jgi:hypothetical protein
MLLEVVLQIKIFPSTPYYNLEKNIYSRTFHPVLFSFTMTWKKCLISHSHVLMPDKHLFI